MRLRCKLPTLHCTAESQGRSGKERPHLWAMLLPSAAEIPPQRRLMIHLVFSLANLRSVPLFRSVTQPSCKCQLTAHNYFSIHGGFNRHEWGQLWRKLPLWNGKPWNTVIIWASRLHIFFKPTSSCSFEQCQWSLSRLTIIKPLVHSSMAFLWACECACSSIGLFTWTDVTRCEHWLQN